MPPVDISAFSFIQNAVTFFRRFSALLLLAVWLPATLHCALEDVGWVVKTCGNDCVDDRNNADDSCETVEAGNYRPASHSLLVATPVLLASVDAVYRAALEVAGSGIRASGGGPSFEQPRGWIPAWSFVRRLAPPSRAPSTIFA